MKENPKRLNNDLSLIVDELHSKHRLTVVLLYLSFFFTLLKNLLNICLWLKNSEYKRIKKIVFKRQVNKAYEILCRNDTFVQEMEIKMDNMTEEGDEDIEIDDIDLDTIDDQALAIASKGDGSDGSNEINNMITSLYQNTKKKSNLKQVFESSSSSKHVHFNDFRQEKIIENNNNSKKRKLLNSSENKGNAGVQQINMNNNKGSENENSSSLNANDNREKGTSSSNQPQSKKTSSNSSYIYKKCKISLFIIQVRANG